MRSRIQPLGSCPVVLALLIFAGSAMAQDVRPRCAAGSTAGAYALSYTVVGIGNTVLPKNSITCEADSP
jgi:hypothetical protein